MDTHAPVTVYTIGTSGRPDCAAARLEDGEELTVLTSENRRWFTFRHTRYESRMQTDRITVHRDDLAALLDALGFDLIQRAAGSPD